METVTQTVEPKEDQFSSLLLLQLPASKEHNKGRAASHSSNFLLQMGFPQVQNPTEMDGWLHGWKPVMESILANATVGESVWGSGWLDLGMASDILPGVHCRERELAGHSIPTVVFFPNRKHNF